MQVKFFIISFLILIFSYTFSAGVPDNVQNLLKQAINSSNLTEIKAMIFENQLYNYENFNTNNFINRANDLLYFWGYLAGVFQKVNEENYKLYSQITKDEDLKMLSETLTKLMDTTEPDSEGYFNNEDYKEFIEMYKTLSSKFSNTLFIKDFALVTNALYKQTYEGNGFMLADKYNADGYIYGVKNAITKILNGDETVDNLKKYIIIPLLEDKNYKVVKTTKDLAAYIDLKSGTSILLKKLPQKSYIINSSLDVNAVYMIEGIQKDKKGEEYILLKALKK